MQLKTEQTEWSHELWLTPFLVFTKKLHLELLSLDIYMLTHQISSQITGIWST